MIGVAGRQRRESEPSAVRAARARERHLAQLASYRFLAGLGPRRSVTVTPPPLRYWQYNPARPGLVLLVLAAVALWLGLLGWLSGAPAVAGEAPLAAALGLVVLLLSTSRLTVSDWAVSTDVAGLRRTSSFAVVPLDLVREVRRGAPPAEWPSAARRGGWWPGRTRVAVRYLADDGATDRAFTVWVRDPAAFADALR